jgi:hypothetical protein
MHSLASPSSGLQRVTTVCMAVADTQHVTPVGHCVVPESPCLPVPTASMLSFYVHGSLLYDACIMQIVPSGQSAGTTASHVRAHHSLPGWCVSSPLAAVPS